MVHSVTARFALSFLISFILLASTNGKSFEQVQEHDLSVNGTNGTVNSQLQLDPLTHELTAALEIVAGAQDLHGRQASSETMIVADPARPPTFIYYCGILTQICANIADALSNFRGTDGAYTTTLGYSPKPYKVRNRRRAACKRLAPQCVLYYSCDTVSKRPVMPHAKIGI